MHIYISSEYRFSYAHSIMFGECSDGDKIPIDLFFLDGEKIKILKIILSPCFVNIFDGDKNPIGMFLDGDKIKI